MKPGETTGKVLSFYLEGPDYLKGVKVKLNYALYDGIPCISKWMEIENKSGMGITLDEFTLEQLAMAELESPVEAKRPEQFLKPNIHVESDSGVSRLYRTGGRPHGILEYRPPLYFTM